MGIVGSDLNLIDKVDLIDMGLSVGDRVRLIRLLADFKYCNNVLMRTRVLWSGKEWDLTPCWPIFPVKYTLTQTSLAVRQDRCFGVSQDRVDLSAITDVDFRMELLTSIITITSTDATMPVVVMTLSRSEG